MDSGMKDMTSDKVSKNREPSPSSKLEENERKERVNALWEQMNSGLPAKIHGPLMHKTKKSSVENKRAPKTPGWMVALGFAPQKTSKPQANPGEKPASDLKPTSEEAKQLAAAALSAVKNAATTGALSGMGKVEITEVRDFAGQDVEVKKLVDADSKEAEKAKGSAGPPSALDNVLEQIKKKQKLSVLDKTKKDWGEFKEENKGLEEELGAYKKSSNQYLDKVSFLQRADLREFERERDARLTMQAKRKSDMREDDF